MTDPVARAARFTGWRAAALVGLTLAALGAGAAPVLAQAAEAAPGRAVAPPSVTVVPAAMTHVTQVVSASGGLLAREDVVVAARVSGAEIVDLRADVGDAVTAGQVLAQLNDQTLTAQLRQADANLASAAAAIAQAEGQLAAAIATATQSRTALARTEQLRRDGTAAQASLDQAQAAADSADATVQSARAAVSVAGAQEAQAKAAREIAALNLSWAEVTAPVAGIIADRSARRGDLSAAGTAMFEIIRDGQIEAELEVVETDLVHVVVGDPVTIRIAGLPPRGGTVRRISPQVDPVTRLGTLRVSIDDQAGLRAGAFASADIMTDQREALTVPVSAVTTSGGESFVQRVMGDRVEQVTVSAGVVSAGLREIRGGLAAGDLVLLRAGAFFRTGDLVTPVPPVEAAAEAGQ